MLSVSTPYTSSHSINVKLWTGSIWLFIVLRWFLGLYTYYNGN